MKTKILVTELQYKRLLSQLNEQDDNWGSTLKYRSQEAPQWLTKIIGNKEDGYDVILPQSDDITKINEIIKDSEVETYLSKLKDMTYGRKIDAIIDGDTTAYWRQLSQTNRKYKAAIVKLWDESGFAFNEIVITSSDKSEPIVDTDDDTGGSPDLPISFPLNSDGSSQFFADNEWVILQKFKDEFKTEVIDKIIENMEKVENAKTPVLNNLTIETSCSRLSNGIPKNSPGKEKYSDGISFIQLSTERNNMAKTYVINQLKNIGVDVDNVKINRNPKGGNKDGTSGGNYSQGDSKAGFTQFKYLKMKLDVTIPGLDKGSDYPIPYEKKGVKTTTIYNGILRAPEIPYRIPGFKWISVWNPKTRTICKKNPNGEKECKPFDGKKVIKGKIDKTDWSRNPKSSIYTGVGN
jgi:hypothetical protein